MPDDTTDGARAETLAARFLVARGLSVLTRNYRVRGGEIDLVCADRSTLVFVEVRLRRHDDFGGAAASVTTAKRRRLILAARHYLARTRRPEAPCRFDCVLLSGLNAADIDWVRDAFGTEDA